MGFLFWKKKKGKNNPEEIEVEVKKEEKKAAPETITPVEKKEPTNATKKTTKPTAKKVQNETVEEKTKKAPTKKVYHISLRKEDGNWQVKYGGGKRAIKLFDTQAEAIKFAEERAESQDGSISIHKKDGKIRKQDYSKKNTENK